MSYSPNSSDIGFSEMAQAGLDANTNAVSNSLDIRHNKEVFFNVIANTGTHGTHIVTLQCSVDNIIWDNTSTTLTGLGMVDNISITTGFVRLRVSTVEGAPSTIDVTIQAK